MDTTSIIIVLLGMLNGIIGWNVNSLYKRIEKLELDIDELRENIMSIKSNYLTRFDNASEHRHEIELKILTAIAKLDNQLSTHIAKTIGR